MIEKGRHPENIIDFFPITGHVTLEYGQSKIWNDIFPLLLNICI